ncbi:MAG: prepilin-type N-terminal cleavage/methylation domain-containing protein [Gemmatimonadota bacterium]|nr:prepilin-type N-terminal cleavage/methylation domain-containing protein [Gemmatimonadota bacterium]MDX2122335.1 prepilin-type N-terminal cleavage/methylation domain-containing protein [Gemmatimonadota bacterium]
MRHSTDRRGFTLIEVLIAMVILTVVMAGLGRFVATFMHGVRTTTARTMATEVARARLQLVANDPRYTTLVSLFGSGAGADTVGQPGFPAMRRRTFLNRDQTGTPARDITTITVRVTDPTLPGDTISLTTQVARP